MEKIPVLIKMRSSAHRDGIAREESLTVTVPGTLSFEKEMIVLEYQEQLEETMPPTSVQLLIHEDFVTMNRLGDVVTQMVFRMGSRAEGFYHTPFGDLSLATFCTGLSYDLDENGGALQLVYQLDMNGHFAAMHVMDLELTRLEDD